VAIARLDANLGVGRARATSLAIGAVAGCTLVAAVDPSDSGTYPSCPTQALLGFDCPACGTLRGVHAITRGRLGDALSHNVLLLVAVPVGLLVWWRWVRAAAGRPVVARPLPAWVVPVAVSVALAFTVLRNLDVTALHWLDSAA
jgi:hypothetical protein